MFEIVEILVSSVKGQRMSLTSGTDKSLCTYLIDCLHLIAENFQEFYINLFSHIPHQKEYLTLPQKGQGPKGTSFTQT